jgi:hypothetical protein
MKKIFLLVLAVCLLVGTTGCFDDDTSPIKTPTLHENNDGTPVFNTNMPEENTGAGCRFNINSVNGERKTYEDSIFYSGEDIRFDFIYEVTFESIDFNTLFLCFLDGILIPFSVDNDSATEISYTKAFKAGDSQSFVFTPDLHHRQIQSPSRIRFAAVGNFDGRADALINIAPPSLLTIYSFDIYPAEGYQPIDTDAAPSVLSGIESAGGHFVSRETFFPEIKENGLGDIAPFSRVYMEGRFDNTIDYTDFVAGKDELRLLASVPPGKYRTVVFRDDEPVAAFDGSVYLDWESPAEGTQTMADIPLNPDILPREGLCNVYPIHIAMDDFPDGTTSMVSMDSIRTSFKICTVEV